MNILQRILMTISCHDCDGIAKVPDAGKIYDGDTGPLQIMHNGLKVRAGGYHGDWMAHIIRALRGHHEPQEEFVFHELLRYARHNSQFVELGSFWSYYTMWYLNEIPGSQALCIEPDAHSLEIGRFNCDVNGLASRVRFLSAWVGEYELDEMTQIRESDNRAVTLPCMNIGSVLKAVEGRAIEILHMDVQGAELPFLKSIKDAETRQQLRFIVLSSHHSSISGCGSTHADCLSQLRNFGAHILAEHDVQESFSGDGLIVASFLDEDAVIELPPISRNRASLSLFPEP